MAAQSGITPTAELQAVWSSALPPSASLRILKIVIKDEQLVASAEIEAKGSYEEDFELFRGDGIVEGDVPAYYLYRLDSTDSSSSEWVFYSYVPDTAPVRGKMLYASSRNSLARSLGDSRFKTSIFATDKNDLTLASYLSHLSHASSDAPLTAREQEMAEIRAAEAKEQREGSAQQGERRSMLVSAAGGAAIGLEWSEEAKGAVEELAGKDSVVVQLEIEKEKIVLSASQPTELSLPPSSPAYTFYRHLNGLVFIYSCPPTSPIKSRLVYSSSAGGVSAFAKSLGAEVVKKIETSDPAEIDDAYILAELGPLAATPTSVGGAEDGAPSTSNPGSGSSTPLGAAGDKPSFARPARPGRKR